MKILSKKYNVSVIRCDRAFSEFCTVMNFKGLDLTSTNIEKHAICNGCLENGSMLNKSDFKTFMFEAADIDEACQDFIGKINTLDAESLVQLKFKEIPVGKLSAFETIIKFKKTNMELTNTEILHLRTKIMHAARSISIAHQVFAQYRPRCVFIFNPQYAVGGAFSEYCIKLGVKVYGVNFTFNLSEVTKSVLVWNWARYKLSSPAIESWANGNRKVTRGELVRAKRHLVTLEKAKSPFVYSSQFSGKSTRKFFRVPENKKILLLAMSSYDEIYANFTSGLTFTSPFDSKVFSSQIEWVLSTVHHLKDLEDVVMIIRPHPREIANKRDSVQAEHSSKLELAFQKLPPNVYVDWPKYGFSIYDHFKEIHTLVTGWSSVGIEAMLSGVPCVSYDSRLLDLPSDIHFTGASKLEYFQNITRALGDYDSNLIRSKALNWYAFAFSRGSIRLSGVLHDQLIFRRFTITRRFADNIEHRFPRFAKWYEVKIGNSLKDKGKLLKLVDSNADNLFE